MTTPRHSTDPATLVVTAGRPPSQLGGAVNSPIVLSSTYHSDPGEALAPDHTWDYGRSGNPTWAAFEEAMSLLEGGPARVFASGLAAVAAAIGVLLERSAMPRPVILAPRGGYYGTLMQLRKAAQNNYLSLREVDLTDTEAVLAELQPGTILWLESPSNPLLEIADLPKLIAGARACGALSAVDNTFATPLGQQPLTLGADIVIHSATKFISGHSDVLLGVVISATSALDQEVADYRRNYGAIASPMDTFLALRGLRTLAIRLERAQGSATQLATLLESHPAVFRVRHPSLPSHPGHDLAASQLSGFGAILAIELADAAAAQQFIGQCQLWVSATSLGGVESMLERRRRHAGEPDLVPPGLVRMSVGIENVQDLWADLRQALG